VVVVGNSGDTCIKAVVKKGAEAFRVTWAKGHAEQSHIESGITTAEHKAGNDKADLCADQGAPVHGKDVVEIAGHMRSRQDEYQKLFNNINDHTH
jgi:hypothetical protein